MIAATLSESLTGETSALIGLLSLGTLWRALAALLLGGTTVLVTELIVARTDSLGLDPNHRGGTVRLAVHTIVLIWLAVLAARALLGVAPLLTAAAAGLTVAIASLSVLRRLPGLVAGVWLALRGRLREGDRVTSGELRGTILRLGPFESVLVREDGARLVTATHRLAARHLTIEARDAPRRVELVISLDTAEASRTRALLSPYRMPGTPVTVTRDGDRARLALFVWPGAELAAERALSSHDRLGG